MAIVKDNVDFNSVESGIINYSYATGILNAPHEGSYGILFSIKRENGQIWQMCRDFSNGYLYQRHRNADGWLPWRITYDTSLLTNNGLLGELANALGEYQGITNVTEYTLQYNTPLSLTTGYTIVFLRHEYYRSMAIVSVGSASGLQVLHETHGGEAQGFYVGNDAIIGGVRLQSKQTTLTITSFIDTQTNQLKVAYIKFGL